MDQRTEVRKYCNSMNVRIDSNSTRNVTATLNNISKSGACIATDNNMPLGNIVTLSINNDATYPYLNAQGSIVWKKYDTTKNTNTYGILFKTINSKFNYGPNIFDKCISPRVDMLKSQPTYLREISSAGETTIKRNNKDLIMYSSCSYLGLDHHTKVKQTVIKAVEESGCGISSSRLLGGTTTDHLLFEKKLAQFIKTEECLLYVGGYMANIGCISALALRNDHIIVDAHAHASLIDGCMLAKAETRVFAHNDMSDLEKKLQKCGVENRKLIVTDGVFSMSGHLAKLDDIYSLAQKYNAGILLDDAHGIGVIGKNGAGTAEHFGLEGKIDIIIGTLSKAFGHHGGFIATKKHIADYLKYHCRTFIFSLGLSIPIIKGLRVAFDIFEKNPQIRKKLWENADFLKTNLKKIGYNIIDTESVIIPIFIGDDEITARMVFDLENAGVFVDAVIYPAVKKREACIRLTPTALHSNIELEKTLNIFSQIKNKYDAIT